MNLIDFFAMGGQERRRMLDDYVDDLNLERFLPQTCVQQVSL